MKNISIFVFALVFLSCIEKASDCEDNSAPYWTVSVIGNPHNTRIQGENITIRKAFQELVDTEINITPNNGFITLKLHLDKSGNFCNQENFQIDTDYQATEFNDGDLITKLENISSKLEGWLNDTESKTYYLIRLKIQDGQIAEIF